MAVAPAPPCGRRGLTLIAGARRHSRASVRPCGLPALLPAHLVSRRRAAPRTPQCSARIAAAVGIFLPPCCHGWAPAPACAAGPTGRAGARAVLLGATAKGTHCRSCLWARADRCGCGRCAEPQHKDGAVPRAGAAGSWLPGTRCAQGRRAATWGGPAAQRQRFRRGDHRATTRTKGRAFTVRKLTLFLCRCSSGTPARALW